MVNKDSRAIYSYYIFINFIISNKIKFIFYIILLIMNTLNKLTIDINNIFNSINNYKFINSLNNVKSRNIKNGLSLTDAFLYRFYYAFKNTTKEFNASKINFSNRYVY